LTPIKILERYMPVAASEIPAYGKGSLIRFSSVVTNLSFSLPGYHLWFFENHDPAIIAFLENSVLEKNDQMIQHLFGDSLPGLVEETRSLADAGWRGWTVSVYGQPMAKDEGGVHFLAHCFLPQVFQSELDKTSFKPTDKLVVGKVTQKQADDFSQRRKELSKLFQGTK
jgi:hypothetical protein